MNLNNANESTISSLFKINNHSINSTKSKLTNNEEKIEKEFKENERNEKTITSIAEETDNKPNNDNNDDDINTQVITRLEELYNKYKNVLEPDDSADFETIIETLKSNMTD